MSVAPSSAVAGVALAACGTPDMSTSGSSDTICVEEGFDATSAGDETSEGCLFVPFCAELEDVGSTDKLDLGFGPDLPCEPDCPPPPPIPVVPELTVAEWDYDHSTDTYYRHASESELDEHGWVPGTVLISADTSVAALTNARGSFLLGIPVPRSRGIWTSNGSRCARSKLAATAGT
jgi:hypothetical protein